MENQRLYELAVSLSERTDESLESCIRIIQNLVQNFQSVMDALKEMFEETTRIWKVIKDTINPIEENESKKGWFLDWDMRKKSQVINNRPSFLVRKIIR